MNAGMSANEREEQAPRRVPRGARNADRKAAARRTSFLGRFPKQRRPSLRCLLHLAGNSRRLRGVFEEVKFVNGEKALGIDNGNNTITEIRQAAIPAALVAGKSERQIEDGGKFRHALDAINKNGDAYLTKNQDERRPRDRKTKMNAGIDHVIEAMTALE